MKSKYLGIFIMIIMIYYYLRSDCRKYIFRRNTAHNNKELNKIGFRATVV